MLIPLKKRVELGLFIKSLREEKKISLTQLSDLTKINISDLNKIEKGEKLKINPFHLKAIANIFLVDYKLFYEIVGFLEAKDFDLTKNLKIEKNYSKKELILILSMYYSKIDVELLFKKLDGISKKEIENIFLYIDFLKSKRRKNEAK